MSATLTTTETETTEVQPTATLVARVPRGSNNGLVEATEAKLERLDYVTSANIDQLHGIKPRGGVVHATVDVTLTMNFGELPENVDTAVRSVLTDSVLVEELTALSAPQPAPAGIE